MIRAGTLGLSLAFVIVLALAGSSAMVTAQDEMPSVSLDPYPQYSNTKTVTFNGTATHADSPIASVEYRVDSGSWKPAMATDGSFGDSITERYGFTIGNLDEGLHIVEVKATTRAGYATAPEDYAIAVLCVDTIEPSISITQLSPDPSSDNTPTLVGLAQDSSSPIAVVEYQVDSGDWAAALAVDGILDSASENYTFTTAALTDGLHMVQVRARDAAGNVSALAGDNFTVDTTAPSLVLDAVSVYTNNSDPVFSGTATDAISPIASVDYQVDSGDWAAALAVDGIFDSASENYTFTTATLTDGLHMVQARAQDAAGNVSALVGDNFTVDTTPPLLVLDTVPGYTSSSTVVLSGTATDAISPIKVVEYQVDSGDWAAALAVDGIFDSASENYTFTTVTLNDGLHMVKVRARDAAGNVSALVGDNFTVDITAPSLVLDTVPGYTNISTVAFSGTATDAISPIASVDYCIDGGAWMEAAASDGAFDELTEEYAFSADLADGSHTIAIRATDGLGNVTGAADYISCYFIVDTNAPSVSLDQPGGNPTNDNSPTFNGSALDASTPIAVVQYRIDGGEWVAAEAADGAFDELGEDVSFTTMGLCDGAHLVELMAIDTAGNTSALVGEYFTVDTTAPFVSIDDIPDPISQLTDIRGSASDTPPGEIERVQVVIERKSDGAFWDGSTWVDSESWLGVLGNASWSYPMPVLADGQCYRISAVSVDTAGNLSVGATESFTVFETAPAEADPPAIPEPADDDLPATPEPVDADLPAMTDQVDDEVPATPDPTNAGTAEVPEPVDLSEERDSKNSSALWSWLLISGLGVSILAAALVARRAKARF